MAKKPENPSSHNATAMFFDGVLMVTWEEQGVALAISPDGKLCVSTKESAEQNYADNMRETRLSGKWPKELKPLLEA